jgi:hypothetical protein
MLSEVQATGRAVPLNHVPKVEDIIRMWTTQSGSMAAEHGEASMLAMGTVEMGRERAAELSA